MFSFQKTGKFKKDVKLCFKRGYNMSLLEKALNILGETGELPPEYFPHPLVNKKGTMDAHIKPDWILIYRIDESDDDIYEGNVILIRTGTHSDLFR